VVVRFLETSPSYGRGCQEDCAMAAAVMSQEAGAPVRDALGWALPALGLPGDSGFFQAIPEKKLSHYAAWEKRFKDGLRQRKNLLLKERPNGRKIETEELQKAYATVREEIPATAHAVIERFIDSAPGWHAQAEALAGLIGRRRAGLTLVSNEVGEGVHPETAMGLRFRDLLGSVNQRIAAACDTVVLMVAGIPLTVKAPAARA